jgi:opacity protein-like surface antigen
MHRNSSSPAAVFAIDRAAVLGTLGPTLMKNRLAVAALACLLAANAASAACVNRFVSRTEPPRQVVTLLTGKLTFQEAQALAASIQKKEAPPLEWLSAEGRVISKQFGELKVVRPMPVGCDGKSSGVVMIVNFATSSNPSKKMTVKLDAKTTVEFEQQ